MNELLQVPFYQTVMVIDNDEVDRYITGRNIAKYSFAEKTIFEQSAKSALAHLKILAKTPDKLPDLIFVDINMPEMNGFSFLEEYGDLPEAIKENTIIIMLSSSTHPRDLRQAKNNIYVSKYFTKPLTEKMLNEISLLGNAVS